MTPGGPVDPMAGGSTANGVPPGEAFALLGNETRIEILQELWASHDPNGSDGGVLFSDLFERVDIEDTGNFTYHLEKLGDHFVRKTDTGYELTRAGFAVVQTVIAGSVHRTPTFDMASVDAECPLCGSEIAVSYSRTKDTIVIQCTQCPGHWPENWPEGTIFAFDMPPAGLRERSPEEVFRAILTWRTHRIETMVDEVCPVCSGWVDRSLTLCEDHRVDERVCDACGKRFQAVVAHVCSVCKETLRIPLAGEVLFHPAVIAFFYDHGIEHWIGTWEAILRAHEFELAIPSTEPLRLQVTFPRGTDEIRITLDEELSVLDVSE